MDCQYGKTGIHAGVIYLLSIYYTQMEGVFLNGCNCVKIGNFVAYICKNR